MRQRAIQGWVSRLTADPEDSRQIVVGAAALLVIGYAVFRAWAVLPGWFYRDDYRLLLDADVARPDLDYLLMPHDSALLPGTRFLVWLVEASGPVNWPLAAAVSLVLQVGAASAAAWMLLRLFGARWGALAPLALYLCSAMTIPSSLWWISTLNQFPLQIGFFVAVGSWVEYLKGRRLRWLAVTVLAVCFALAFFVKALLVVAILAGVAVGYFASGSLLGRVVSLVRRYWPAAVAGTVVVAAYLSYYVTNVRQPFRDTQSGLAGEVADSMLGTAFATGAFGGPWHWYPFAPPGSVADPPSWVVHLCWVGAALVVLYGLLRRERTLRAWVILGAYLAGLFLLVLNSRAPMFGRIVGLEYRYLTDAACALALCVGLAYLPLRGAVESSAPRPDPLLRAAVPPAWVVGVTAFVCLSGLWSSALYIRTWHSGNASEGYVQRLDQRLRALGPVDLADEKLPESVIPQIFAPDNQVSRLVRLLGVRARFPEWTDRLVLVGKNGTLRQAFVADGVVARGRPGQDCSWVVKERGRTIRVPEDPATDQRWIRIGYLAGADSPVQVSAAGRTVDAVMQPGLNNLYVQVEGKVRSVRIDGLDPGTSMCVDRIEVGHVTPGFPL